MSSLSKLQEMVKDREAWRAGVHGSQRVGLNLATGKQQHILSHVCLKLVHLNVSQWTEQSIFVCDRVLHVLKGTLLEINIQIITANQDAYGCDCETK